MAENSKPRGGIPSQGALDLEEQYKHHVIDMVGAEKLQKVAQDHREQVNKTMLALLRKTPGISSPDVKEAALAFANTPGRGAAAAYDDLTRALLAYRPAAEKQGEGGSLQAFENALVSLIDERGKWINQEREYQEQAKLHRAEALRILTLINQGGGAIQ